MSDLNFIYYSLKSRLLNSFLSMLLTAFGISIAILINQFSNHVNNRLSGDARDIDIVVGAKGSPLQLVLSSVYHIDLPTGNIPYDSVKELIKNPKIKTSIPLALGDNWKGYRIVGTTPEYMNHYNAKISEGRLWDKEFEIVAGSSVDININEEFIGSHGILEGGSEHGKTKYKVTGIMKPTGTVLDRLILTSLNSVLQIHGLEYINYKGKEHHNNDKDHDHDQEHEDADHHNHKLDGIDHHSKEDNDEHDHDELGKPEITALLITTKSPVANVNLPRQINRDSFMQAANPSLEITRLTSMLGLGSKSLGLISTILISIAILSIFSGLASNLENRMGDLATLRAIGYSKKRIFKIISLEGITIVVSGIAVGIIIGIVGFNTLTQAITPLKISQASFSFTLDFILIIFLVFLAGLISAIFPAYRGSKISVAKQLSRNI
ncbi:MAG: hypothetical protein CFH30_00030 [Alphaproteobacteria bacterium MarineAlpha8_Bin1]|nr:MAG: hypothetical protein CFH30_00030 [Alphaproteobacteria bacterium MarineAlpha8_Bin1]|tara:strand:+ start:667 stop:1974 length:1308 start_codon:yes stop_codon:yes gene_type:complete